MITNPVAAALAAILTLCATASAQRGRTPTLRLNAEQLGATSVSPDVKRGGTAAGNRPVIMLTGYWPPTNEMLRKFSTNPNQNPSGWIGSDWEGRGYDVHSFFPEFPNGSFPRGRGDFEVDYQDTVADWNRLTSQLQPRAIITFSNGGAAKNWEFEMNGFNHQQWLADALAPVFPNPSPPDGTLPAGTSRRSTLPVRDMLAAIKSGNIDVDEWVCFRGNGGNYLSEFIAYQGMWYKNTHSDRAQPDWCVAAGHVHVGPHSIPDLEQAVFACVRELIKHVDRVTADEEQQNFGFGHRGIAIQTMRGAAYPSGSQDLIVTGLPWNQSVVFVMSSTPQLMTFNSGVFVTSQPIVVLPGTSTGTGTFEIRGIRSPGPGTFYCQLLYGDIQLRGRTGISNALKVEFR